MTSRVVFSISCVSGRGFLAGFSLTFRWIRLAKEEHIEFSRGFVVSGTYFGEIGVRDSCRFCEWP